MNVDKREMEKLILAYFDEGLNASDQRRLATLLRDEPDAQAMFHSHMRLEGSMVSLAQAGFISDPELEATVSADSSAPVVEPRPPETRSVTLWIHRIVIGTAALVAGFYLAQIMAPSSQLDIATPKVGHFSRIIAAEWVSGAPTLGSDVTLGTYELKSGIVEFEFDNGATVILEGPAHFEVNTAERTFLHHGRVRTHVPPQAYGFTMDTQTMHVVDLGTEFGMEVNPDGAAEVHVFDGEVEILQREMTDDTPRLFLAAGEGLRLEHSGLQSDIDADLDAFVDQFTLESRAATYLDDLADQLAKVQQEQKDLTKRLRQAESKTKQSPELQKLRKAANLAKQKWSDVQQKQVVHDAISNREKAKARLERLFAERTADNGEGKRLRQQLDDANATWVQIKKQVADARRNGNRISKSIHKDLRGSQKSRNTARREYQRFCDKLRNEDAAIKEAQKQLSVARKRVTQLLAKPEFATTRNKAEKRRKAYLAKQRELLSRNETIAKLRMELNQVQRRSSKLRQKIQQTQQAAELLVGYPSDI